MKKNKRILFTSGLLIITVLLLWSAARQCYRSEREVSFQRLKEYTVQIGNEIRETYNSDRSYLEGVSVLFARENLQNLENASELLASIQCPGMISRLELLLPGDQILTSSGELFNADGKLSFQEEAGKGYHISRRCHDLMRPDNLIVRHYVPIIQHGNTTAILCGIINLDELPERFTVTGFDNSMQLYIAEGKTGNFLQDTWHNELGNMSALGDRRTKLGYSWEQFHSDIAEGRPSTVVFLSKTTGEYLYSYSTPLGVEDWMITVSVPERIVFDQAQTIMGYFYVLAALLLLSFAAYFTWIILELRREKAASEQELRNVKYMLDVEKQLFDVNLHPEHFSDALQIVADFLSAETAFFWLTDQETEIENHLWSNCRCKAIDQKDLTALSQEILPRLQKDGSILSYDISFLSRELPLFFETCRESGLKNLMMIPVSGLNGETAVILGAWNMKRHWNSTQPLEQVALSFSMAINHYHSYHALIQMGQFDSLTGLKNRNSFHAALNDAMSKDYISFACIYIDANGLHEMNNHLGHQAGDMMLKSIADTLNRHFPTENVFRIGGDEFVILCPDKNLPDLSFRAEQTYQELLELGYEISLGIEWRNQDLDLTSIVNAAENAMQENKLKFYQKSGKERQIRILNSKLEQMIAEKNDADTFLSVLSPEFTGVYFVDLNKDTIRHLFIPDYFETILNKTGDKFSKALSIYAQDLVKPEYVSQFQKFCNYHDLETLLQGSRAPEFTYQKKDGTWLKLRVLKFKSYTADSRETLWIFSNFDNGGGLASR